MLPECHSASYSEDGELSFHLLIEDCAPLGQQYSLDESWSREALFGLAAALAELHGRCLRRRLDPNELIGWQPGYDVGTIAERHATVRNFVQRFADQLSEFEAGLLQAVAAAEPELRSRLKGESVLIHGDLHPLNVIFRRGEEGFSVKLLDWQFAGWSVAAADLADILQLYCPPLDRTLWECHLLRHYNLCLAEQLGRTLEFQALRRDYDLCLMLNILKPAQMLGNPRLPPGLALRLFKRACLSLYKSEEANRLIGDWESTDVEG
jgi:aminoglycoside phosphotransferase (APT) family kinase protein